MAIPVTLTGLFVSVLPPKPYKFTDDSNTERSGITRKAFVCHPGEAPIELKFADEYQALHEQLDDVEFGTPLEIRGDVQGNSVKVRAIKVQGDPPPKRQRGQQVAA